MKFNVKKIIINGLIAGFIIVISALTMVSVVGNEMDTVLANRGLPPLSNLDMTFFCCLSLIFGIFLIFQYAVLKPYFKSRLKAVVIAALTVWVLAYLIPNFSSVVYGFMPLKLSIIGTFWGLLELLLAGVICSKLYEIKK
ncbi:hypothetical protein FACS1894180_6390 [Bacteroidia bacterium]|nr:hypothetical protein FACS1894178_5340 [Bacteroidia bacterium]GHV44712.1 hypothetical protein FACS1894180_6390 [Bacteroidia bacterium]